MPVEDSGGAATTRRPSEGSPSPTQCSTSRRSVDQGAAKCSSALRERSCRPTNCRRDATVPLRRSADATCVLVALDPARNPCWSAIAKSPARGSRESADTRLLEGSGANDQAPATRGLICCLAHDRPMRHLQSLGIGTLGRRAHDKNGNVTSFTTADNCR
jgi:hypothetical protein